MNAVCLLVECLRRIQASENFSMLKARSMNGIDTANDIPTVVVLSKRPDSSTMLDVVLTEQRCNPTKGKVVFAVRFGEYRDTKREKGRHEGKRELVILVWFKIGKARYLRK